MKKKKKKKKVNSATRNGDRKVAKVWNWGNCGFFLVKYLDVNLKHGLALAGKRI